MRSWWKHNKKLMNAGELKHERVEMFKQLLELGERYSKKAVLFALSRHGNCCRPLLPCQSCGPVGAFWADFDATLQAAWTGRSS